MVHSADFPAGRIYIPRKRPMQDTTQAGTILIRDGSLLPEALQIESEPCVPGWRLVKDLDGYGLDRKIRAAGWAFFCMAGDIQATAFGIDTQKMVRKAIQRVLTSVKTERFNSPEITRVDLKHFLGLPYATVNARARHIQESIFLSTSEHVQPRDQVSIASAPGERRSQMRDAEPPWKEPIAQPSAATPVNL